MVVYILNITGKNKNFFTSLLNPLEEKQMYILITIFAKQIPALSLQVKFGTTFSHHNINISTCL